MSQRSARRPLVVLALLALVALLVIFLRTGNSTAPREPSARAENSLASSLGDPASRPPASPVAAALSLSRTPTIAGPTVERLERSLNDYLAAAVYPPWSRAFDPGTEYLLTWNKPATADLPMDDRPGQETSYHFDADKAHVAYGEAITSWLEVWKNGDPAARLPVELRDAWVIGTSGPKQGRLVRLSYHDDGRDGDEVAGDRRYSNRFVPSSETVLSVSEQVHFYAVVSCCGGVERAFMREFTYAPRKVVTIRSMTDLARSGSLVLTLDLDVHEAGQYSFEANLTSPDGSLAIGYTQQAFPLDPGRRLVDLVFFGRMFAEKGVDGPYLARDVRGQKLSLDGEEHNIVFTYPGTHLTRPYRRSEFSSAEWDSPEKKQKIERFRSLLRDTRAGKIGGASGPADVPRHIHIDENGVPRRVDDPAPPAR